MAKQIIAGNDLHLFDSTGKSLGFATNHTLTISTEQVNTTSKDHSGYGSVRVNTINWEITSENLFTTEEYESLFDTMMAKKAVYVHFGLKTVPSDETKTVANDDYNAWSIAPTANVADGTTESVGSFSDSTDGVSTAAFGFVGKAFITNLQANAPTGENATFSISFTGDGAIKKITKPS